jgi:hypothetical protein
MQSGLRGGLTSAAAHRRAGGDPGGEAGSRGGQKVRGTRCGGKGSDGMTCARQAGGGPPAGPGQAQPSLRPDWGCGGGLGLQPVQGCGRLLCLGGSHAP